MTHNAVTNRAAQGSNETHCTAQNVCGAAPQKKLGTFAKELYRAYAGGQAGKAAPSIPRVVLQEPKLFIQETGCLPEKPTVLLCRAGNTDFQGPVVVQGKHTHETAAVDNIAVIAHGKGIRLCGGPGNKILNILTIVEPNVELPHKDHPILYKMHFIVYNGENP